MVRRAASSPRDSTITDIITFSVVAPVLSAEDDPLLFIIPMCSHIMAQAARPVGGSIMMRLTRLFEPHEVEYFTMHGQAGDVHLVFDVQKQHEAVSVSQNEEACS